MKKIISTLAGICLLSTVPNSALADPGSQKIIAFMKSLPHTVTSERDICFFGSSSWDTWCVSSFQGTDQHGKPKIPNRYYHQLDTKYQHVIYEALNVANLEGSPGILTTYRTRRYFDPGLTGTASTTIRSPGRTSCRRSSSGNISPLHSNSDTYNYSGSSTTSCTSRNNDITIPGSAPEAGGYRQDTQVVEIKCSDMTYRTKSHLIRSDWSPVVGQFKKAHYTFSCQNRDILKTVSKELMNKAVN